MGAHCAGRCSWLGETQIHDQALVLTAAKRDVLICTEQPVAEPVRTRHRSTFGPVAGGVRSLEAGDGTEGEITRAAVCAYPEHTISTALSRGPDDRPLS